MTDPTDPTDGTPATGDAYHGTGICEAPHPLLDDVGCQRLLGHPGPHGAQVETRSTEMYLEWTAESTAEVG